MGILPILIGWPLLIAAIVPLIKQERIRGYVVYAGAGGVMVLAAALLGMWLTNGAQAMAFYQETEWVNYLMIAGELFLTGLIVYLSIKYRKYPVILLSVGQTALGIWTEFRFPMQPAAICRSTV